MELTGWEQLELRERAEEEIFKKEGETDSRIPWISRV